ncbi:26S proteasome non-ATPase regulatory subunit 4-like [Dendronephthya gigantea]|uniref:26S proteasome non-ATPase regulatory subunit 4-like n=1 Tax=Dendronephthya gigantea TaxID=151771 RepID=UPI00106AF81A|nr:26S proteasome non-ATPase regulatory subunit 4-like [Dendronephthya gigantea]
MVLESTVICVDNSEYMRNGDFLPTRIQAQQDAVNLVCRSKARQNPENNVGLMTLASLEVLVTLTTDVGKVLSTLHSVKPKGAINIVTGIRVAHLALKHRQSKNHRMRIIAFVGSPLANDEKELVRLAKKLKKEKVNVDIVNFGEEETNTASLTTFINTVNGKDGTSSHLVTVPPGPILADALISSAIIVGEEGAPPSSGGDGLFDPSNDPELALAIRVSLEEQRQRQEEENKNTDAEGTAPSEEIPDSEEALLQQALRMSGAVSDTSVGSTPFPDDVSMMSEADQIAYAIKMSLQGDETGSEAETLNMDSSRETTPMETDPTRTSMDADIQDFSEEMADPDFLHSVLGSLPNVDPDSEAVKAAIGQATQQRDSKKKDDSTDKEGEDK